MERVHHHGPFRIVELRRAQAYTTRTGRVIRPTADSAAWESVTEQILASTKQGACQDPRRAAGVVNTYVEFDALPQADVILYTLTPNGRLAGFVLGKWRPDHAGHEALYIIVVCALPVKKGGVPGAGKALIHQALAVGRQSMHTHVSLHALPHVEGYYKRIGFKYPGEKREGTNINGYYMEKPLANMVNWRENTQLAPTTPNMGMQLRPRRKRLPSKALR